MPINATRITYFVVAGAVLISTQTAFATDTEGDGFDSPIEGQLQARALNEPQRAIAEMVEEICPNGLGRGVIRSSDLQSRCTDVVVAVRVLGDLEGAATALQNLANEEVNAIATSEVDSSAGQMDAIGGRLANLRAGGPRIAVSAPGFDSTKVAAASQASWMSGGNAGDSASPFGFFVNGNYAYNDKDATSNESGFESDGFGVTAGLDYQVTADLLIGAAFTYNTTDADILANAGNMETDSYGGFGYGSFRFANAWYLDAMVGYTHNDHEQARNLAYTVRGVSLNQTALSQLDSREVAGSLKLGYDHSTGAWVLGPYARLDIGDVEIDGYSERMSNPGAVGSGVALQVDDQSFTSVTTAFGLNIGYVSTQSWGTWYPQVFGEYVHEFDNDAEPVTGRYVDAPTFSFSMGIDDPDRDFANIGVSSSFVMQSGISAFVSFQTLVGYEDLTTHVVELGVRVPF